MFTSNKNISIHRNVHLCDAIQRKFISKLALVSLHIHILFKYIVHTYRQSIGITTVATIINCRFKWLRKKVNTERANKIFKIFDKYAKVKL